MALSTVSSVAKRANIIVRYVDENVGTGDNSTLTFDLDNDHVIEGTVTLSYAASGSNAFTELTLTTHYTINDYEAGRITLTAAGRTELSTNILYASYSCLGKLTSDQVDGFITKAHQRLYALTGKYVDSTQLTEYYDGAFKPRYPRTDRPFANDAREWDSLQLQNYPVISIDEVTFLDRDQTSFKVVYSDDGGSFTDNTEEANTSSGTSFNVFAATPAANDAIYFGMGSKFLGLQHRLQVLGVDGGSLAVTWEYYNGSSWASLTTTAGTTGSDKFTANGKVTWTMPSAWEETTVNSSNSMYFVRARLSAGSFSTSPKLWEAWPDPNGVIYNEISLRTVDFKSNGRVTFKSETLPHGKQNIRMVYTVGVSVSDPKYQLYLDLEDCLAALMCAVAITGGSFDDETHYRLGEKEVTIGEVYVNVAEVVKQLVSEISELKRLVGQKFIVV